MCPLELGHQVFWGKWSLEAAWWSFTIEGIFLTDQMPVHISSHSSGLVWYGWSSGTRNTSVGIVPHNFVWGSCFWFCTHTHTRTHARTFNVILFVSRAFRQDTSMHCWVLLPEAAWRWSESSYPAGRGQKDQGAGEEHGGGIGLFRWSSWSHRRGQDSDRSGAGERQEGGQVESD